MGILQQVVVIQCLMWIGGALLVLSGAAAWLVARVPPGTKRWAHRRPRWFLWLMLLSGLGLISFSLGLVFRY
jgi:hypothetical protein